MDKKPRGLFRRFFSFIGSTLLSLFKGILRLVISITVLAIVAVIIFAVVTRPEKNTPWHCADHYPQGHYC